MKESHLKPDTRQAPCSCMVTGVDLLPSTLLSLRFQKTTCGSA